MRDFPVTKPSLQSWEQGVTVPGKLSAKLWRLSSSNTPRITDAPVYSRWKTPNQDTAEIRKLRMSEMPLLAIAKGLRTLRIRYQPDLRRKTACEGECITHSVLAF
jgi:hypothetical protein